LSLALSFALLSDLLALCLALLMLLLCVGGTAVLLLLLTICRLLYLLVQSSVSPIALSTRVDIQPEKHRTGHN